MYYISKCSYAFGADYTSFEELLAQKRGKKYLNFVKKRRGIFIEQEPIRSSKVSARYPRQTPLEGSSWVQNTSRPGVAPHRRPLNILLTAKEGGFSALPTNTNTPRLSVINSFRLRKSQAKVIARVSSQPTPHKGRLRKLSKKKTIAPILCRDLSKSRARRASQTLGRIPSKQTILALTKQKISKVSVRSQKTGSKTLRVRRYNQLSLFTTIQGFALRKQKVFEEFRQ
jgi:hypothetical protein